LVIERKVDFPTFRRDFEKEVGQKLVALLLPNPPSPLPPRSNASSIEERKKIMLKQALENVDAVCQVLVAKGLVARIDPATLDPELVDDWSEDLSDLKEHCSGWNITLSRNFKQSGFRLLP
jgi:hypothetical protein